MDPQALNRLGEGALPGLLGIEFLESDPDQIVARLEVRPELFAPNGFLHAGTVVALADTVAGYGCMANLPEGATGFTTIELKANLVGTARAGIVEAIGTPLHRGRTTQVWNVTVQANGEPIAHFSCTQLLLYSQSK